MSAYCFLPTACFVPVKRIVWRYILKRLLLMVPTLFGVAALVFFLLRVVPGDIVELKYAGAGVYAPKEAIAREDRKSVV